MMSAFTENVWYLDNNNDAFVDLLPDIASNSGSDKYSLTQ